MAVSPSFRKQILELATEVAAEQERPGAKSNAPNYNARSTQVPDKHEIPVPFPLSTVDTVTEAVGGTPMLRAKRLAAEYGLQCNLWLKLEYMNPGGSVKDRPALRMLQRAEEAGTCKPGDIVIEASSGNMGLGLAMVCATKGYQLIVTMPMKMSQEKENVMLALGAIVVRTKTSAAWDDANSHISIAYTIRDKINALSETKFNGAKAHCLDQYQNAGNLDAHYNGTATEIIKQLEGKIDMFVATVGTGGTGTGVSTRIRKEVPSCRLVAVDPDGSIMSYKQGEYDLKTMMKAYEVEGIGYDFHPSVYHQKVFDEFYKSKDRESFLVARDLIRLEGVLCGGSAGSAVAAAIAKSKTLKAGQNVVVIIPDSIRNYVSKFIADDWMLVRGVFEQSSEHSKYRPTFKPEGGVLKTSNARKVMSTDSVSVALKALEGTDSHHVAVIDPKTGYLVAVHSSQDLMLWVLQDKGDIALLEVMSAPHSIYGIVNKDLDTEKCGATRLALMAMAGAEKQQNAALTVVPDQLVEKLKDAKVLEMRQVLSSFDFKSLKGDYVSIITMDDYVATKPAAA